MTNNCIFLSDFGMSSTVISAVGVVPHYFKKRKDTAYTGQGLGIGIAFTAYPYITEYAFSTGRKLSAFHDCLYYLWCWGLCWISLCFQRKCCNTSFSTERRDLLYGLTEAFGGIGAFAIPYAAGYIDKDLTHGDGVYVIGACVILAASCSVHQLCSELIFGQDMRKVRVIEMTGRWRRLQSLVMVTKIQNMMNQRGFDGAFSPC